MCFFTNLIAIDLLLFSEIALRYSIAHCSCLWWVLSTINSALWGVFAHSFYFNFTFLPFFADLIAVDLFLFSEIHLGYSIAHCTCILWVLSTINLAFWGVFTLFFCFNFAFLLFLTDLIAIELLIFSEIFDISHLLLFGECYKFFTLLISLFCLFFFLI